MQAFSSAKPLTTSSASALQEGAPQLPQSIRVLEDLEDEKFYDLDFVELNACSGGCVGGVLNVENPSTLLFSVPSGILTAVTLAGQGLIKNAPICSGGRPVLAAASRD